MLATLTQNSLPLNHSTKATQILVILPKLNKSSDKFPDKSDFLGKDVLEALLARRKMKPDEISDAPVSANLMSGALCAWVMPDLDKSRCGQKSAHRNRAARAQGSRWLCAAACQGRRQPAHARVDGTAAE